MAGVVSIRSFPSVSTMSFLINSLSKVRCFSGQLYLTSRHFASTSKGAAKASDSRDEELLSIIKKMPAKPKQARSAMSVYVDQRLKELLKEHPDKKNVDLKKIAKEEWNHLEIREPYDDIANAELTMYKKAKDEYDSYVRQTVTIKDMLKIIGLLKKYTGSQKREISKIKALYPTSTYKVFMKEYTETERYSGRGAPNLSQISAAFKALSEDQVREYERKAQENKVKLEKALEEYEKSSGD